jgi:osmoprotectant transport system substrate-binding protein
MNRKSVLPVGLLLVAAALAGCGKSGSSNSSGSTTPASSSSATQSTAGGSASITVGSAGFSENALLADIYADAIAAKGVKVTKKLNIGERGAYIAALKDGSIDFVPEYTGSILPFLDPKATAKSPADVYAALQTVAASSGFEVLNYAAAQDSDTITVTKATADKYKLTTIADLASVAKNLTLGAPAQFKTRPDGVPALKSVYGVEFGKFTPTAAGGTVTVTALKNGSIDAADIFSTDPAIVKNGFVSLQDPKSQFAAQNIVPLVAKGKLNDAAIAAANAVSAKLDTATLAALVAKVADGADADTVAKDWLTSQGLIG